MKYSAVLMLFLGAISSTEAKENSLVQVITANGMTAVVDQESSADSDSDDNDNSLVQTQV
jgi:hypothetical protein